MKGRRHTPEQIVRKLHHADRLIAEGKSGAELDLAAAVELDIRALGT